MKTRLLIIIGIVVVIAASLSYYVIYDSSTTVFISCDPRYEQIDGKCVKKDDGVGGEPEPQVEPEGIKDPSKHHLMVSNLAKGTKPTTFGTFGKGYAPWLDTLIEQKDQWIQVSDKTYQKYLELTYSTKRFNVTNSDGTFEMIVINYDGPNKNVDSTTELESQLIMKKAQSLGIDNIMEAVDSKELRFEEKRQYIKIRYEESPNLIPSLNIRIKDFSRNLEYGEAPTFTVIETGYAYACTSPKLEVYLLKQEIGNDHTSDDLIYEYQIVYPCPEPDSYSPILKFWDEKDFRLFPICEKEGRYLIVGDSGFERGALEEYYCNALNED